jgi:hypothetical protein
MSEAVVNLISGIVGALVGGAASLAGTMLVGRMHFVRGARVKYFKRFSRELQSGRSQHS